MRLREATRFVNVLLAYTPRLSNTWDAISSNEKIQTGKTLENAKFYVLCSEDPVNVHKVEVAQTAVWTKKKKKKHTI